MALDGAFLRHIKKEIEDNAIDAKIDKIYQPSREELVLALRTRDSSYKLLMSARANSPRIHFTKYAIENPQNPPMFCMLLRKRLLGARLVNVRQPDLERVLYLDFAAKNELGDKITLTIIIEIMGKYSNIIFVDENNNIIDSLKRVDNTMSSKRLILPGLKYNLPPSQKKESLLSADFKKIIDNIETDKKSQKLSKYLLSKFQGISPIICREIAYQVNSLDDIDVETISQADKEKLCVKLESLSKKVQDVLGSDFLIYDTTKKPIDISFIDIKQYENLATVKEYESFSMLLDEFYCEKDKIERMKCKSQDLHKLLNSILDRLARKITIQKEEIETCKSREKFKEYGDLINANLYFIKDGIDFVELKNFYNDMKPEKIKLDPRLSASKNAQKYYKDYKKAKTGELILAEQIENSIKELEYINSVLDFLGRINTEKELLEIREELFEQGYVRKLKKDNKKVSNNMEFKEYVSTSGLKILVGKNNKQNDKLTLKYANNNDIWFHVKDMPGSHVVLITDNKTPDEESIMQAANIAAYNSKAKNSSAVPVDYTEVRNVNKPNGAKPGMVIYVKNKTIYVTPDELLINLLKK